MNTATINQPIVNDIQYVPNEPYKWLTLDIETAAARPEDAERWMRMQWAPNPTLKPETIGKKYLDMLESKKQKLALMDESPIICVSLRSDTEIRCLHHLYVHEAKSAYSGLIEGFASEAEMLIALRNLVEAYCGPETIMAGHNIKHFDLPKLRNAYLRNNLRIPRAFLDYGALIYDTMLEYGHRFSLSDKLFISLDDLLELMGIESHKGLISGDQIGDLLSAGQFDLIIEYALLDVIREADVYLKMTGQAVDLK